MFSPFPWNSRYRSSPVFNSAVLDRCSGEMNYSELSRPLGGRASFVYSDSLISDCGNLKHSEMFGSNFS